MCLFRAPSPQTPEAMAPPISIATRQESQQSQELPTKKELLDPDEVTGVEFGSTRKKVTEAAGKTGTGAKALRIPLNVAAGAGGGGPNV